MGKERSYNFCPSMVPFDTDVITIGNRTALPITVTMLVCIETDLSVIIVVIVIAGHLEYISYESI